MDPKNGSAHCPACGAETKDRQVICTACGVSIKGSSVEWSTGAYIGLLLLSLIIPLFSWIYGGIKVNNSAPNSKRKSQAWHYIIAGFIGLFLNVILTS